MNNFESPQNKNASIKVIESILNSRIDQMIALTLPTDRHRHEILETIRTTYSLSQRLSSFCDYMIDYVETLSSKLDKAKNELHECPQTIKVNKSIKYSNKHTSKGHKHSKHEKKLFKPNFDLNLNNYDVGSDSNGDGDDLDIISNVEYLKSSTAFNNPEKLAPKKDDYQSTLKLLNVQEGQLSVSVNDLINQNQRLQRLHNQDRAILLKQHAVIHGLDDEPQEKVRHSHKSRNFDDGNDIDFEYQLHISKRKMKPSHASCSDNEDGILEECKQLKNDFQQISNEIQNLNSQVQRRYHYSKKRCRNH